MPRLWVLLRSGNELRLLCAVSMQRHCNMCRVFYKKVQLRARIQVVPVPHVRYMRDRHGKSLRLLSVHGVQTLLPTKETYFQGHGNHLQSLIVQMAENQWIVVLVPLGAVVPLSIGRQTLLILASKQAVLNSRFSRASLWYVCFSRFPSCQLRPYRSYPSVPTRARGDTKGTKMRIKLQVVSHDCWAARDRTDRSCRH
jgi:hypothetical protein